MNAINKLRILLFSVMTMIGVSANSYSLQSIEVYQEENDYLTVDHTSLHYDPSGGSMTVNVSSNISWDVWCTGGGDWMTVSPGIGSGDGVLTVTATENANPTPREATITVLGNGLTQNIEVYQEGNGSLTVDCTKLENINNIYNMLGQKVEKSSIDRLPIGIYVINGTKVLISK